MNYLEQSQMAGRHIMPDLVRAFALFGIVLVNVAYLAFPGETTYHSGGLNSGLDNVAYFGVNALFLFKSYTLFSFMFGAGLAYQMMSAERAGKSFAPRYFRRILGLIILGMLHVTFAFVGDILIIYAVLGILLFLFRNAKLKTLLWVGIGLVILQILITFIFACAMHMGETYAPEDMAKSAAMMQASIDSAFPIYQDGSFAEIAARRWKDWTGFLFFALPVQGPGVLGFFLLGLAAVRSNVISDPNAKLWSKARRVFLPIGVIISFIGAWFYLSASPISASGMVAMGLITLGAPFASYGYLGLIAKWANGPATRLKVFLARGGTATLTAYLMQSLILSLIFCGYGLGLYGKVSAAGCIGIAVIVGIFTIGFSSLWRKKFARGPMEALLRSWTYLGKR